MYSQLGYEIVKMFETCLLTYFPKDLNPHAMMEI